MHHRCALFYFLCRNVDVGLTLSSALVINSGLCLLKAFLSFPYLASLVTKSQTAGLYICGAFTAAKKWLPVSLLFLPLSAARSSSTRTGIITSIVSVVSAVTAHWQMSPSPARMTHCSAMTATVTSSPPNVSPVIRSLCQVKVKEDAAGVFSQIW